MRANDVMIHQGKLMRLLLRIFHSQLHAND